MFANKRLDRIEAAIEALTGQNASSRPTGQNVPSHSAPE